MLRHTPHRYRRIRPSHRPRGIAVVMVLGLLAITLAISYATLRGQGTTSQLSRNNSRALDARVAAQSGLAAAIRKISENNWAGIGVGLSANVTNQSWYQVSFSTGDARLQSADSQYAEYPFRVTIDSVGYAADPLNPAVRSEHKSRCIVQLVRKQLVAAPANWPAVRNLTLLQYADQNALVQFPVRIGGPTCLLGKLIFCTDYPNHTASRDQYLTDLNARRIAGLGDDRPFPSSITLRGLATGVQDAATVTLLTTKLGVTPVDTTASPGAPVNHPGTLLKYRLYPGGREYDIPVLQTTHGNPLQNATIVPDVQENPLGIVRSSGALTISHNVNITGTIVADPGSEVQIGGTGVNIKALNLPSLYGTSDTFQLPAALLADDLKINSAADVKIEGMTLVWDKFELKSGLSSTKFDLKGNLITDRLEIRGRTNWTQNPLTWSTDRSQFLTQLANVLDPNRSLYFPDYMERQKSFTVKPALTFSPNSSGVKPHWHDWSQPIYQPDAADPGLRWEIIRWEDNL